MRRVHLIAAIALSIGVALGACTKKESATGDTGLVVMTDTAAGSQMGDTGMTGMPAASLTDANIVYLLDWANMMDSTTGSVAATKGTSSEVRDFGKRMMRDHHQLRQQGSELAKKLSVTPTPPANDTAQAHMDKVMSTLNGAAKGRDFDKTYIDSEVETHKTVLEMATNAMNQAQNAELKNLIQKAAPLLQVHLDLAESIQRNLK